jgi:hypothetical protein
MASTFPLYLPSETRRLFQSESLLRRFAQAAHLSADSRLLEIHGSLGGLALCRALKCQMTIVEPNASAATALKERAQNAGIEEGKLTWLQARFDDLSLPEGAFDGVFCFGRVIGAPSDVARRARPWLAEQGRLAFTCILSGGRNPSQNIVETWSRRLGHAVLSPRETLLGLEAQGFEPEIVELLSDSELDEFYREVEASLSTSPGLAPGLAAPGLAAPGLAEGTVDDVAGLKAEIELHRSQNGKAATSYGVIVARRKEPGEKPPLSRDGG